MPRGVPVATVAINNATNAGLLAVRLLGISDVNLQARYKTLLSSFFPFSHHILKVIRSKLEESIYFFLEKSNEMSVNGKK